MEFLRRVKRVASRELSGEEAPAEAAPRPMPLPPLHDDAEDARHVVDPTVFSERHRKKRHHRIYRFSQLVTFVSYLAALASLVLTLFAAGGMDHTIARGLSAGGILLAMLAVTLAKRTQLSQRVRGYAVAALVLGVLTMGASFSGLSLDGDGAEPHRQEPVDDMPRSKVLR